MRFNTKAATVVACLMGMVPCLASAGPFADDMAKCLVKSSSEADRADLMRWMFAAMSVHPDLAPISRVSAQARDALNATAAKLFNRLLFDACKSETEDAIKNEGPRTIEYAFQTLGQVAARGLFSDPHVTEAMAGLQKGIDQEKVKQLQSLAPKR